MRAIALLVAAALLFSAGSAVAQSDIWRAGARVSAVASGQEDVWAAGAVVTVRGNVRSDVWAAGAEVDVNATAGEDIWAAGAIVGVSGEAARNVRVAGARVTVSVRAGQSLNAAGARVVVGPQTEVKGPIRLAGADVEFSGNAQGPADFYGDTVQINGRVAGDVHVRARSVTVGRTAVIGGNVVFETINDPVIEQGAAVTGTQTVTLPQPRRVEADDILTAIGVMLLFGVGAGLVLGLMLLAGARPLVERAIDVARNAPGRAALIGLAVLVLIPLGAILLMATVIGIPIGLLVLLAFPLALLIAAVIAAFVLSDWALNRSGEPKSVGGRILLLLAGLVVLLLLGMIPFVGFLVWLLVVTLGLGALWMALRAPRQAVASA